MLLNRLACLGCRHPGSSLNAALRGVLAETALTGRIRYDWQLLKPLCHSLIDSNLAEFAAEELEVCGTLPPHRARLLVQYVELPTQKMCKAV